MLLHSPEAPQRGEAGRGNGFYRFVLMHSLVCWLCVRSVTQSYYYCAANHVDLRARVFVRALLFLFLFLSFSHIVPGRSLEISLTAALSSLIGWCIRQAAVSSSNCSVWEPISEFMPTYSCALAWIEDQSPVRCVFLLLFLKIDFVS